MLKQFTKILIVMFYTVQEDHCHTEQDTNNKEKIKTLPCRCIRLKDNVIKSGFQGMLFHYNEMVTNDFGISSFSLNDIDNQDNIQNIIHSISIQVHLILIITR